MAEPREISRGVVGANALHRAIRAFGDRAGRAIADETEGAAWAVDPAAQRAGLAGIARHAATSMALTLAVGDKGAWIGTANGSGLPAPAAAVQRRGNLLVVLHDPACAPGELRATLAAMEARAAAEGMRLVYYLCTPGLREELAVRGYRSFHMGAEAIVDLRAFSLEEPENASLRRALRHAVGQGIDLGVLEPPIDDRTIAGVAAVNDRWLAGKGVRELCFSQGYVSAEYLRTMPLCVARAGGRIVGYCNVLCPHVPLGLARAPEAGRGCREVMVDLMRSDRGVSWSLAHAVWLTAMLWAKQRGYDRFNMGMAPLAGVGEGPEATFTERVAKRFRAAGGGPIEQGLHHFKSLYKPTWEARYLCWRGRAWLPWVFWQTTSMVLSMSSEDRRKIASARETAG